MAEPKSKWVIDTNVLIVATTASKRRPPRQIEKRGETVPVNTEDELQAVFSWLDGINKDPHAHIVLDFPHNMIEDEYGKKIDKDEFGRMVIANKLSRCQYFPVFAEPDEHGDAIILHDAAEKVKDRADRRMVAAALESGAPIANACDTDWLDLLHNGTLAELGISVHHIIEAWCREEWARVKARKGES